jgi:dolichyl-phosphate beta-glucosyltransferase
MKPFLSVIIPAYNEAERLPLTLADIDRKLSAVEYSSEVIVVDDGSRDATVAIVRQMGRIMKNLRVIENPVNHGKGWAVRKGMLAAKGNWRLFTDADNSTSIDQFANMAPFFKEGYAVVIGSRAAKGAKLVPAQPWYRQVLGKVGNLIIRTLAVPGVRDTQCGFKCFSEEAAERIFSVARVDRWGFDVEALALARTFGYRVKEIPVTWVNSTESKVKGSAYLSTLIDVWRIRRALRNGTYRTGSGALTVPSVPPPRDAQPTPHDDSGQPLV